MRVGALIQLYCSDKCQKQLRGAKSFFHLTGHTGHSSSWKGSGQELKGELHLCDYASHNLWSDTACWLVLNQLSYTAWDHQPREWCRPLLAGLFYIKMHLQANAMQAVLFSDDSRLCQVH